MLSFALSFLVFTVVFIATQYYWEKQPLKDSIGDGLVIGIFSGTVVNIVKYQLAYQLTIVGSMGIMLVLLQTVNRYHVHKDPLEESIIGGLIVGIGFVISLLILDAIVLPIFGWLVDLIL